MIIWNVRHVICGVILNQTSANLVHLVIRSIIIIIVFPLLVIILTWLDHSIDIAINMAGSQRKRHDHIVNISLAFIADMRPRLVRALRKLTRL